MLGRPVGRKSVVGGVVTWDAYLSWFSGQLFRVLVVAFVILTQGLQSWDTAIEEADSIVEATQSPTLTSELAQLLAVRLQMSAFPSHTNRYRMSLLHLR